MGEPSACIRLPVSHTRNFTVLVGPPSTFSGGRHGGSWAYLRIFKTTFCCDALCHTEGVCVELALAPIS